MELIDFSRLHGACATCSLAELCLPFGLSREDMERLEALVRHSKAVARNHELFRNGEPLTSLYLVRSGSFKLQLVTDDGNGQIVGFFLPGEILGFDALATRVHTCTARALEHSSVCQLPYEALTDVCSHVPAMQASLMRLMGMEISLEQALLLNINRRHAVGRVASFLVSLALRFKRLHYSGAEFRLSMSRYDLGNYLGLTIETVSRAMSRLQRDGLISVDRRLVRILDADGLQQLCEQDKEVTSIARAGS